MFSSPYRLNGRMNEILDSMKDAWEDYNTDPRKRDSDRDDSDYIIEMFEYKDEAKALAARAGIDELAEADWAHDDGETPAVTGDEDEYHWERGAADEIAAAWNTYKQLEQFAEQFPGIPDEVEEGPEIDGGRRYQIKRALKDQHDVSTIEELRKQYTDDDGEPLYGSRREFREQLRTIARTGLADELDDDTDAPTTIRP